MRYTTTLGKIHQFSEIPGPPRIPIWGNLYLYKLGIYKIPEYHNVLLHMFKRYGPLVREDIGPRNTIIHAFDPSDAKTVFANEGPTPMVEPLQETTQLYRKRKNTSPGLGNTNGEEWYRLRSAVRKVMLRPKEVQRYLPQVNEITDGLIRKLAERREPATGEIKNLRQEVGKWSREVSGWICFDKRLGCFEPGKSESEAEKMIQVNRQIFELSAKLKFSLPIYKMAETIGWRRLVRMEEIVHECVEVLTIFTVAAVRLIDEAVRSHSVDTVGQDGVGLLPYLLSREELSNKDVQILILSVFSDGLSTTVPTLLYNLYCLSVNPEVQAKVRDEVRTATDNEKYISADVINNKLPFLKAVVKEAFRLYPIGTEISRIVQTDLVLSNYRIPKGTHVHLNQTIQNRSEKYFKNPNEFQPERWLRDGADSEIDPILSIPFGHGTRTCAGRRFAEQDLYVSLSKILLNFELSYPKDHPPLEQVYEVLLFPKEPLRISFKPL